jgi:CO dehydrogenase nickel-insertion accessory protein CooC1
MIIVLKHELNKEESILRIKNMIHNLKVQYGSLIKNASESWNRDSVKLEFYVKQMHFSGIIEMDNKLTKLDFKIPLIAKPFKTKIISEVEKYGRLHLK